MLSGEKGESKIVCTIVDEDESAKTISNSPSLPKCYVGGAPQPSASQKKGDAEMVSSMPQDEASASQMDEHKVAMSYTGNSLSSAERSSLAKSAPDVRRRIRGKQSPPPAFREKSGEEMRAMDEVPGQALRKRLLEEHLARRAKKLKTCDFGKF